MTRAAVSVETVAAEDNPLELDVALCEGLARHAPWGLPRVQRLARIAAAEQTAEHAARAERNVPRLHGLDRDGGRIDRIECDPSWSWLLDTAVEHEMPSLPWRERRAGAFVVRNALGYVWGQVNTGVLCPVIMTLAAVPVLERFAPELAALWVPRLTDPRPGRNALAGQAYTEKQGGSDLRATLTTAVDRGDGAWELHGHKWFVSAPMADIFLTLAQTSDGLSCFLVERGPGVRPIRLKDKLGTRSLPTAEVEFRGARAWLVGTPGQGMAPLVHNLGYARLGPAVAPEMRAAVAAAIHYCRRRRAFGQRLVDQPAMANVLADLAIESEAATAGMLRLAAMYDDFGSPLRRLATSITKYWGCGRVTGHIAEAMQCLGGNGYSESFGLARLLRDASVHAIWEGSGNVTALDVLRGIGKNPETLDAFLGECAAARGGNRLLDDHLERTATRAAAVLHGTTPAAEARRLVEDLALAFYASLLVRYSVPAVADAFCAGRLGPDRGLAYGTLPSGTDTAAIIERALPQ
ncbi:MULTISPECIES: acyl-CoA dehydrogenase family protein [unclassified Nocardia]|uniref:acyl-CoA dehydrogenase family protein n=1 Tax=unclassified Nocardia TaxID=2637762 RepID=UPI001CE4316F|nr:MULTISPECIES: acyl-CoA dehydrogenase family protein [unclassified Nocardia]